MNGPKLAPETLKKIREFAPTIEVDGVAVASNRLRVLVSKCQLNNSEGNCPCEYTTCCQLLRIIENREAVPFFGKPNYMNAY